MSNQLQRVFWLTGALMGIASVAIAPTAWAEAVSANPTGTNPDTTNLTPPHPTPEQQIPSLDATEQPATTVREWIAQMEAALVQVTGVRVETSEVGLQVVLETTGGDFATPTTQTVGNALIADIPNAVLALPDGEEFQQTNPIEGIALVSVTGLPGDRVRVAITGTDAPPTANLSVEASELVLAVTPGTEVAETDEDAIQVLVTGQQESYRVPNASTATRTDTPLLDIPQSIQVIPRQILEDQGVTQIGEALRNVSGINQPARTTDSFGDFGNIRGFEPGRAYFVNGLRNPFGGFNINLETANIEQIEVLRGPASVLYGQVEPGGIINLITRQPLSDATYRVEGNIGSFNFYRSTLDLSGPLNSEETILYRLTTAYQNSESFIDFLNIERYFVAPVISFQLGENTQLVLEGQYLNNSGIVDLGLPATGTLLPNPLGEIPRNRFLGDPEASGLENRQLGSVGYRLEHDFNEDWTIRNAFRFDFLLVDQEYVSHNGLEADNRTVTRNAFRALDGVRENYTVQTDVIGVFNTGSIEHNVLFGVELNRFTDTGDFFAAPIASIDVFDPVYGATPGEYTLLDDSVSRQSVIGVYAQDLLSITDNLTLLLGGRFDFVDQRRYDALTGDSTDLQDTAFSPRVGIVYQPVETLSLYANFSRSFAPSNVGSRNPDGTPFDPTTGEQFEIGVKTEFLDGRVFATLAAYELTRQNIITRDPDREGFSLQIGEQRSRGIEFDVAGELFPGFNLIASYSYIDAEITEDNSGNEGNQPNNVPEHSGSLWATYEIQDGALEGLGLGLGLFVIGDRQGDLSNTFTLPSYIRTDAALYYRQENWQVSFNIKNLFDVDYFDSAFDRNYVYYGTPLTVQANLSIRF